MKLISDLISFFSQPETETKEKSPNGLCPVCWGYQQYDGKIRHLIKDKQIDINNHKESRPFFEEVIKKHVDGITLKEGLVEDCPTCSKQKEDKPQPLKRHTSIVPLSKDHHHALLLCWKITQGLKKNIDVTRIKTYVDWFWENHVLLHFKIEEKYLFPVLGSKHPLIQQALNEHKMLEQLFTNDECSDTQLEQIAAMLNAHIRFEERVLFQEIQQQATNEQLNLIEKHHQGETCENWHDEFWK